VNEAITAPKVRMVDGAGTMMGIFTREQAFAMAREVGLDLVEVNPGADPPVCKLMDFGKFKYELKKKEKESRKAAAPTGRKEIRLRPKTDRHDLEIKMKRVLEFLEDGYRVQLTMRFRGREMAFMEDGRQALRELAKMLGEVAVVEGESGEGKQLTILLAPKQQKK
jgi:translation initiation factor IF-3